MSNQMEWGNMESNYHGSEMRYDKLDMQDYLFHNIDVYNTLYLGGKTFDAVYQTGCSFIRNDYSLPSPKLGLSEAGGTSELLLLIDSLYESDFEKEDLIQGVLEEAKELCPYLDSVEKLFTVYESLNDNLPLLEHHIEDIDIEVEDTSAS